MKEPPLLKFRCETQSKEIIESIITKDEIL